MLSTTPTVTHLSEAGNARQGFFEAADFERVVEHLPEYLRDFARFGFFTGWRKGSIASLRWSDVGDGVIRLRAEHNKIGVADSMPLAGPLPGIIERRRQAATFETEGTHKFSEYVFHRCGEPIGDFRKAWRTACKAAGVPDRLFHDFRRTAARNLIRAGVPQAVAMKITGHKTDSMFRRYAIVDESQKLEALERVQKHLATETPAERKVVGIGNG